jgi:branched-chain amino acid transport system substrate-binding protein
LPGGGGRHIRCNGKADPLLPAVCSNSQLSAVLGANGKPNAYKVVSDEMIPD